MSVMHSRLNITQCDCTSPGVDDDSVPHKLSRPETKSQSWVVGSRRNNEQMSCQFIRYIKTNPNTSPSSIIYMPDEVEMDQTRLLIEDTDICR